VGNISAPTRVTIQMRGNCMADKIRYEIILYWSKEDDAFIAEVPELPGCAAEGSRLTPRRREPGIVIKQRCGKQAAESGLG
jgi:hypothetical protein